MAPLTKRFNAVHKAVKELEAKADQIIDTYMRDNSVNEDNEEEVGRALDAIREATEAGQLAQIMASVITKLPAQAQLGFSSRASAKLR